MAKEQVNGQVVMVIGGVLDAKSMKAVADALFIEADQVTKDGKEFIVTIPVNADLIKAAREDGICSYGPMMGTGFRASVHSCRVELDGASEGLINTMERLVSRSYHHMEKIGVGFDIDGVLVAECDPDVKELEHGFDLAILQSTCALLLVGRAMKPLNYTQHPLSYFDLSQALSLTQGVTKEQENAQAIQGVLDTVLKAKKVKKAKKTGEKGVKPKTKPTPTPASADDQDTDQEPTDDPEPTTATKGNGGKNKPAKGKKKPVDPDANTDQGEVEESDPQ